MAILSMDGLDCYKDLADAVNSGRWNYENVAYTLLSNTLGRFGKNAIGMRSDINVGTGNYVFYAPAVSIADNTTYYFSYSAFFEKIPATGNNNIFFGLYAAAARRFYVGITNTGTVSITNAAGSLNTTATPGVLTANTWYRFEFKINLGTSTSTGSIEVKVNGTTILNLTGQNYFTANPVDAIRFNSGGVNSSGSSTRTYIDDIVINDSTGSVNNGFLGDVRIDNIIPNGDTAQADFTPSAGSAGYAMIGDIVSNPDDLTFIQSDTTGAKSSFDLSPLIGLSAATMAVQARVRANKSDAGNRFYKTYIDSNGSLQDGATIALSYGAFNWASNGIWEIDPDTSAAWTDAAVNALKLGFEITP